MTDYLLAGSIPAGAGKPAPGLRSITPIGVYPRWCGEAELGSTFAAAVVGLSPLVRGSLARIDAILINLGSIPAGAGKPAGGSPRATARRVYPRWCGEAGWREIKSSSGKGLSPLVRGSLLAVQVGPVVSGSIPAGAGKPPAPAAPPWRRRVYPRWCGEAGSPWDSGSRIAGLSPLVRGSQPGALPRRSELGSIPAGAGKPPAPAGPETERRVYPRWCGEARGSGIHGAGAVGLSPLVRGSHRNWCRARVPRRSIPAGAGKPSGIRMPCPVHGVYPRWCGEAFWLRQNSKFARGLSPLVRGSRGPGQPAPRRPGSIPAGAGKP